MSATAQYYGFIASLVILATAVMCVAKGAQRAFAVLMLGISVAILLDTKLGLRDRYGINDIIVYVLTAIAALLVWLKDGRPAIKYNTDLVLIAGAIGVTIATQNSQVWIGEYNLYQIGQAITWLLLAGYIARQVFTAYKTLPLFMIMACAGNFLDNAGGDPYNFTMTEKLATLYVILGLLWYKAYRVYGTTEDRKRKLKHILIAYLLLIILNGVIAFLRSRGLF